MRLLYLYAHWLKKTEGFTPIEKRAGAGQIRVREECRWRRPIIV